MYKRKVVMAAILNHAAVLGSPISHSLSPVLHTAAYQALGFDDWNYSRSEVKSEELGAFLSRLDASWRGLSLTMPLKKQVLHFGTPRDKWSQHLGVANTVVFRYNDDNESSGTSNTIGETRRIDLYNTDVYGIKTALSIDSSGTRKINGPCMIIGSGSTAVSATAALSEMGAKELIFAARNISKLEEPQKLAKELGMEGTVIPLERASDFFMQQECVISTLPAHAADTIAQKIKSTVAQKKLVSRAGCSVTLLDVVYDPRPTQLMQAAQMVEGQVIGGELMLLWQAVAQVALMCGIEQKNVPVNAMKTALYTAIENKKLREKR